MNAPIDFNIDEFIILFKSLLGDQVPKGTVIIGRDTRPHSNELFECVKRGIEACNGDFIDLGVVTTPHLHFTVQNYNLNGSNASITDYFTTLSKGYVDLIKTVANPSKYINNIIIDASYGVGGIAIKDIIQQLNILSPEILTINLRNDAYMGHVNDQCGAEHVQKLQLPPINVDSTIDSQKLICSFDGDADRIVFHAFINNHNNNWILLDGDKIAAIITLLLYQELQALELTDHVHFGIVQTSYANGASTKFLQNHNIPIIIAKTGVKYLHHKAIDYDIGIYFEANGHGTVIFSNKFQLLLNNLDYNNLTNRKKIAIQRLKVCFI